MNEARHAFLLAILGQSETYHRDYISEKVDFAFLVKEPSFLRQALDAPNQTFFDDILERLAQ